MTIFTIAKWFSDRNGLAKPKRVMTLEDSLFRLRDLRIKQQMLNPACCVCYPHIYWFVTQRAIICSATTNAKVKLWQLTNILLWSDLWLWVSKGGREMGLFPSLHIYKNLPRTTLFRKLKCPDPSMIPLPAEVNSGNIQDENLHIWAVERKK